MDPILLKVVWRCAITKYGAQFVTTYGASMMLPLCATNWDLELVMIVIARM